MDKRSIHPGLRAFALILLFTVFVQAGLKHDFERPVFVYTFHPDVPMSRFVSGGIGIPEPQHARIYLFAAYRYLEGKPLTPREQKMWLSVWDSRANQVWRERNDDELWVRIRKKVALPYAQAQPRPRAANVLRRHWISSSICSKDAYDTASRTLADRIKRFGIASAEVKFWTEGQDAVFRICLDSAPQEFSPAPAGMHPLIRADRDYQIAAALFYAQHFDEAIVAFRRIAQDVTSPWRVWAPYLIGRSMLSKARQTQSETLYKQALAEAEAQFRSVVRDPALRPTHSAAEHLLLRCMMITNRKAALERIARRLAAGNWRETDLAMYLNGLDWLEGDPWDGARGERVPRARWPADPLSQWIVSFQGDTEAKIATATWRQGKSRAWLYAALWHATTNSPDELLDAALSVGAEESVASALRYVAARQIARNRQFDDAQRITDEVIASLAGFPSSLNRAAQLRMQLAANHEEFLKLAPRKVIYAASEMDMREWESQDKPDLRWVEHQLPKFREQMRREPMEAAAKAAKLMSLPRFDDTTADILNERIPLRSLNAMTASQLLPPHLQNELVVATWIRSVLLNRTDVTISTGPAVAKIVPGVEDEMKRFLAAPSEETAAIVLLKLPGARPYVSRGYGRNLPITEHDDFGRNWWFRFNGADMHGIDLPYNSGHMSAEIPSSPALLPELPFLSTTETSEAAEELAILRKTGERGLNWIAVRITAALRSDPKRADAAELLYRILTAGRVGWWGQRPDYDLPHPGLQTAHRMLSTRYRTTKWFRDYQKLQGFDLLPLK